MKTRPVLIRTAILGGLALLLTAASPARAECLPSGGIICESELILGNLEKFWTAVNTTGGNGIECESAPLQAGVGGWIEHEFRFGPRGHSFGFRISRGDVEMAVGNAFQLFLLEDESGSDLVRMRLIKDAEHYNLDIRWQTDSGMHYRRVTEFPVQECRQTFTVEWTSSSDRGRLGPQPDGEIRLLMGTPDGAEQEVLRFRDLLISKDAAFVRMGTVAGIDNGSSGYLYFTPLYYAALF